MIILITAVRGDAFLDGVAVRDRPIIAENLTNPMLIISAELYSIPSTETHLPRPFALCSNHFTPREAILKPLEAID